MPFRDLFQLHLLMLHWIQKSLLISW